jgi:hypothetical protein
VNPHPTPDQIREARLTAAGIVGAMLRGDHAAVDELVAGYEEDPVTLIGPLGSLAARLLLPLASWSPDEDATPELILARHTERLVSNDGGLTIQELRDKYGYDE